MKIDLYPNWKTIEGFVFDRKYDIAIDALLDFIDQAINDKNQDTIFTIIELLKKVCDKRRDYSEKIIPKLRILLSHRDDFIRRETIEIVKLIGLFDVKLLEPIMENITAKIYDSDKTIREIAAEIIFLICKNGKSHGLVFKQEEYVHYMIVLLKDPSWRIRANVLKSLSEIIPLISIDLMKKMLSAAYRTKNDESDEVRLQAAFTINKIGVFLPKADIDSLRMVIEGYLSDEDWLVLEKGIWIAGEIGKENEFILNYADLFIEYFDHDNPLIQSRTIELFTKFGLNNAKKTIEYLLKKVEEFKERVEIIKGIEDTLINLSINNSKWVLPILFQRIEDRNQDVRNIISSVLLRVYGEQSSVIMEQIATYLNDFTNEDWRIRKEALEILTNISLILRLRTIAVWVYMNLVELSKSEEDPEVLFSLNSSLQRLEQGFGENIKSSVDEIIKQKQDFENEMASLQKLPQLMKQNVENLIHQRQFNKAEIELDEMTNRIISDLDNFEKRLNESAFRRFSPDLYENWVEIRETIEENMNDIKTIEYESIMEKRFIYHEELDKSIEEYKNKIKIIEENFNHVKSETKTIENLIDNEKDIDVVDKYLDDVSEIQELLYKIEIEIGQLWISNLEFKDFLEEITIYWVNVKIAIQQFLSEHFQSMLDLREKISVENGTSAEILTKISFRILIRNFQHTISTSTEMIGTIFQQLENLRKNIFEKLQMGKLEDAKKMLNDSIENFEKSVKERNKEIIKLYEELDKIQNNIQLSNRIRTELNQWNTVKEKLSNELKGFKKEIKEEIIAKELMEMHKIINPVSTSFFANHIQMEEKELIELLFSILSKRKIPMKIVNGEIISLAHERQSVILKFSKKIEIIGNIMTIAIKIQNPSLYFIKNIFLSFIAPNILEYLHEGSDNKLIEIGEFEPNSTKIFTWKFKINKSKDAQGYLVKKFQFDIRYRDITNEDVTIRKDLELII